MIIGNQEDPSNFFIIKIDTPLVISKILIIFTGLIVVINILIIIIEIKVRQYNVIISLA